jgi:hypothetical protein
MFWEEEVAALLTAEPFPLTGERLSDMAIPYRGALKPNPRRGELPLNATVRQYRRDHLIRVREATRLAVERDESNHHVAVNQLTALIHYGATIGIAV